MCSESGTKLSILGWNEEDRGLHGDVPGVTNLDQGLRECFARILS